MSEKPRRREPAAPSPRPTPDRAAAGGGAPGRPGPIASRHGRLRRSRPGASLVRGLAATVAVVLVSGAGVAAYAAWDIARELRPSVSLGNEDHLPTIDAIDGAVNLLIVGSDSRQGQDPMFGDPEIETGVLNDVTMLLSISEDHRSATVVSFPRDMFVSVPECDREEGGTYPAARSQKINTTLSSGLGCTVKTVEALTGMEIPYAAEVQFGGVIELSNAVGGVEVCVAQNIADPYTNLYLDAGMHNLQGLDALQFLRTRHGVGDGSDLGRISNQQVFLSALVRQLQSEDTLGNPAKLFSIAKAAAGNMTLSTSLNDINRMVAIAGALKNIPLENIVFVQYPNALGTVNGQSGVLPLEGAAAELFAAIERGEPVQLTGGTGLGSVAAETPDGGAGDGGTAEPGTGAGETPDPSASAGAGAVLPPAVQGQNAGEVTCSAGNGRSTTAR